MDSGEYRGFLLLNLAEDSGDNLRLVFGASAEGHQENGAFAFGVWGKEADDIVVVKSESGGTVTNTHRRAVTLTVA